MDTLETRLHAVKDITSLKIIVENIEKLYGKDTPQAKRAQRVLLLRADRELRQRRVHS